MGIPSFYYSPRSTEYDFGPKHPLKPERLRRFLAVLKAVDPEFEALDPGLADEDDLLRVHDPAYLDFVKNLQGSPEELPSLFGLGTLDTPFFPGMHEAGLAYTGGTVRAAEAVRDGARIAFAMAGGLHHARKGSGSGFCLYNDAAIACSILRERFDRVAYIDIDLHHGDGVQELFWEDPGVLTLSIHQRSPGFYPGTGSEEETGPSLTSINIPLPPGTQGGPWLRAFTSVAELALDRFQPQAVVLQMGADPHVDDPLGRLHVRVQDWLGAVRWVRDLGIPIAAAGGGGYCLASVPRMWTAAVLTLLGREVPRLLPESVPPEWGMTAFLDEGIPEGSDGRDHVDRLSSWWRDRLASQG